MARRERAFARRYGVEVEARPNEAIDSRYPIMCALQAFLSNPCIGGFEGKNGVGAHGVGVVSSVGRVGGVSRSRIVDRVKVPVKGEGGGGRAKRRRRGVVGALTSAAVESGDGEGKSESAEEEEDKEWVEERKGG